jgi:hypothetical protein
MRRPEGRAEASGLVCYTSPPVTPPGPWCSGQTCQPVTLEIAGSNPVGPATAVILDFDPLVDAVYVDVKLRQARKASASG